MEFEGREITLYRLFERNILEKFNYANSLKDMQKNCIKQIFCIKMGLSVNDGSK